MHELPSDLTHSLRSFRGSVYRPGEQDDVDGDLEKGRPTTEGLHEQPPPPAPPAHDFDRRDGPPRRMSDEYDGADNYNGDYGVFEKTEWTDHAGYRSSATQPLRTATNESTRKTARMAASADLPPQTPATMKESVFRSAPAVADSDPAAARFANDPTPLTPSQFYELMGMRPPNPNELALPRHLATEHGLYGTISGDLSSTHRKYVVFEIVAYGFLAVQLVLGALFIVIGALPRLDSHTTVAVLGAVSTFLTGGLALMKGQGLPNRLRQTRDALRTVVFAAEELYVDFRASQPVLFRDVKKVREDYLRVLEEARRNHPDTWNRAPNGRGGVWLRGGGIYARMAPVSDGKELNMEHLNEGRSQGI